MRVVIYNNGSVHIHAVKYRIWTALANKNVARAVILVYIRSKRQYRQRNVVRKFGSDSLVFGIQFFILTRDENYVQLSIGIE